MVEDEINEATPVNYTPSLKSELDRRVAYYLEGGKMVSPAEMNNRLQGIRKKRKQMAYSYLFDPAAAREYEKHSYGTKRKAFKLQKYPYQLIYYIDQDRSTVVIVSLFHQKRNPSKKYKKKL